VEKLVWRIQQRLPSLPDTSGAHGLTKVKLLLRALLVLDADPKWIARSFAIGIFVGVSPFYGTHTLTVLVLIPLLRLHPMGAVVGCLLNPPVIAPFVYGLAFTIGALVMGLPLNSVHPPTNWGEIWQLASSWDTIMGVLIPFMIGCTLVGIVAGAGAYVLLYRAIIRVRSHRFCPSTWSDMPSSGGEINDSAHRSISCCGNGDAIPSCNQGSTQRDVADCR